MHAPKLAVAIMENLKTGGLRRTDFFIPAPRESEGRREKDQPRHFRMCCSIERGEIPAHARPNQANEIPANHAFEDVQLTGNREVFEVSPIHGRDFHRNAMRCQSSPELHGLARLRTGSETVNIAKLHAVAAVRTNSLCCQGS